MNRTVFNFWVDLLSFVVFILMVFTGLIIYYVLPPCGNCTGQGCTVEALLWGMDRHFFGKIHFYLSLGMIILMIEHLVLHWTWVCSMCSRVLGVTINSQKQQNLFGLSLIGGCLIVTIGLLYWLKMQVQ